MGITKLICAIAVCAALFFIIYTFMIEGFQNRYQTQTAYMNDPVDSTRNALRGNSDTICSKFGDGTTGDCAKCLDADGTNHPGTQCGYWPQGKACIPRSGIYRLVPKWLTDKQTMDNSYPQVFDPKDFVYNVGKCGGDTCASFTSCRTCASASACGWCDSTNTCMDRATVTANYTAIAAQASSGTGGSTIQPLCPRTRESEPGFVRLTSSGMAADPSSKSHLELIQEVGTCRPETCGDKKNCFDCTNTSGCGFCRTTGKCIRVDSAGNAVSEGGSTGSSGSSLCATGQISLQSYMCPCSGLTTCGVCAKQPGCGWCVGGNNCVNVELVSPAGDTDTIIGGVNIKDCVGGIAGVATSAGQCAPGAKLGNVRLESGNYKPGDAQLTMIGDNTAVSDVGMGVDLQGSGVGVIGSKPVSPATTSQVTGNGVAPPGGGPYTFTNQPNLFTSPFEEYVKVLIRSQLAAEGVPMNEPFQNPGPNIVENIVKDVRKVTKMNF